MGLRLRGVEGVVVRRKGGGRGEASILRIEVSILRIQHRSERVGEREKV